MTSSHQYVILSAARPCAPELECARSGFFHQRRFAMLENGDPRTVRRLALRRGLYVLAIAGVCVARFDPRKVREFEAGNAFKHCVPTVARRLGQRPNVGAALRLDAPREANARRSERRRGANVRHRGRRAL